jgi:hypothetical protein
MRKYIILAIAGLSCSTLANSQNVNDLVRESQIYYSGTAKSTALGGAMGALGGDMSAISINPAISSTYLQSEFSLSPDISIATTKSQFTGISQNEYSTKLGLGSIGINGIMPTGNNSGLISISMFLTYNRLNNFNQDYSFTGESSSSLIKSYADNLNNPDNPFTAPQYLASYYEGLAYDSYLLNVDQNNMYYTNVPAITRHTQTAEIKGNSGEWSFGGGANISHILYLGGSLNWVNSSYEYNMVQAEYDSRGLGILNNFALNQYNKSTGNGFNYKLGAIVRPLDFIRLGFSMHSPTYFKFNTEYNNWIKASYDQSVNGATYYEAFPVEGRNAEFTYKQHTPWRYTGSAALILGKKGFVSFDYERVDYTSMSAKSTDDIFFASDMSKDISTQLKAVNNYRIGVEYKIVEGIALRGGYALYGSPYSSNDINKDSKSQIVSGGIGYFNNGFFFDIAYSARLNESKFYQYYDPSNTLTPATNKLNDGKLVVTMGWRF